MSTDAFNTPETNVSPSFPYTKSHARIFGESIAYISTGTPNPSQPTLLFLHGNGSSSYSWRNIIPFFPSYHCIAPDLLAMGDSSKPDHASHTFTEHYTFISAFIKAIIPTGPIVFVAHDWGTALALHWAHMHDSERRVAGLVLLEFVRPFKSWDDFGDEEARHFWKLFRTNQGEELLMRQNVLLEKQLPHGAKRGLSDEELAHYRKPFGTVESRRPILVWTNQVPIQGDPSDVYDIATRYEAWLVETEIPKLVFWYEGAGLVDGVKIREYEGKMRKLESVQLGAAGHFCMEDYPTRIGVKVKGWVEGVVGK